MLIKVLPACSAVKDTPSVQTSPSPPLARARWKGCSQRLTLCFSSTWQTADVCLLTAAESVRGSLESSSELRLAGSMPVLEPCQGPSAACDRARHQDPQTGLQDLEFPGAGPYRRDDVCSRGLRVAPALGASSALPVRRLRFQFGSVRANVGHSSASTSAALQAVTFLAFPLPLRAIISISQHLQSASRSVCGACCLRASPAPDAEVLFSQRCPALMQAACRQLPSPLLCSPLVPYRRYPSQPHSSRAWPTGRSGEKGAGVEVNTSQRCNRAA